jgi:hypothetical protein
VSDEERQAAREVFEQLVEDGVAETLGDEQFVSVLKLVSGARYGVVAGLRWAVVDGERFTLFGAGNEKAFVEALEYVRADFDDQLEAGAAARGFDGMALMFAFPAIELVQAMLLSGSPHFSRLALAWLRPTEIRAVRDELIAVTKDTLLPKAVRELATRLVVPPNG